MLRDSMRDKLVIVTGMSVAAMVLALVWIGLSHDKLACACGYFAALATVTICEIVKS